jgi:hypothetical protein
MQRALVYQLILNLRIPENIFEASNDDTLILDSKRS